MDLKPARILALETSCDETAAAVIENGRVLISSVVASQMDIHSRFGGVYPEVASRQHVLAMIPVLEQTLAEAHITMDDVDAIAVTIGPGLAGSLIIGLNAAKGLTVATGLPLVGINHLEGHIYSSWIHDTAEPIPPEPQFPLLALLVSGGHTELNLMTDHLTYRRLGSTLDDAAGEAFDKVARLLGLPYPGGPSIQKAAEEGDANRFKLPRARIEGTWNFSFSGLKTAVLYEIRRIEKTGRPIPVNDLAAGFQAAVVDVLVSKTMDAAREFKVKEILVAGGVSANLALRQAVKSKSDYPVHIPRLSLCTDNAAMVGAAGYYRYCLGHTSDLTLDVQPTFMLS